MQLKLAICQLMVEQTKSENLKKAESMIEKAVNNGAAMIILPEMFNCPYDSSYFYDMAEEFPDGETFRLLSKLSKKHNVDIVAGSVPELQGEVIYNTCFVLNNRGEYVGRHRKAHLFDINIPGGVKFRESDDLGAGSDITVVKTRFGTMGIAICYDIRFPEMFRLMIEEGAEFIVIPGAFNTTTGPVHWETLLKSRAIDNQVFVIGASPARNMDASYKAYGHSAVFGPWGERLAIADENEQLLEVELDMGQVAEVRKNMPLLKHRRTDIYQVIKRKTKA